MNRITISSIFLIVISMVLPTSAIMYASGQSDDNSGSSSTTDNSGSSSTGGGGTTDNSGSSSTGGGGTTDNSGSSSTGGGSTTTTTDSSGSSTSGSTDNSATLPTTSTASNNTGNLTEQDVKAILAVHNRERDAVGVPPLVWSDKLAADAQVWADHLETTGQIAHDNEHLRTLGEGESIAGGYFHGECTWHLPSRADMVCTHSPIGESPENWVTEKPHYHGEIVTADNYQVFGHYTQMVWKNTKEVGCGSAGSILVCRYSPPGNYIGQKPY